MSLVPRDPVLVGGVEDVFRIDHRGSLSRRRSIVRWLTIADAHQRTNVERSLIQILVAETNEFALSGSSLEESVNELDNAVFNRSDLVSALGSLDDAVASSPLDGIHSSRVYERRLSLMNDM
jgi:hypothetical protein